MDGVIEAKVNFASKEAIVRFDEDKDQLGQDQGGDKERRVRSC